MVCSGVAAWAAREDGSWSVEEPEVGELEEVGWEASWEKKSQRSASRRSVVRGEGAMQRCTRSASWGFGFAGKVGRRGGEWYQVGMVVSRGSVVVVVVVVVRGVLGSSGVVERESGSFVGVECARRYLGGCVKGGLLKMTFGKIWASIV